MLRAYRKPDGKEHMTATQPRSSVGTKISSQFIGDSYKIMYGGNGNTAGVGIAVLEEVANDVIP